MMLFSFLILFSFSSKGQQKIDTLKLTLAGITAGTISIDSILKSPALKCTPNDFEIKSFALTVRAGEDLISVSNIGDALNDQSIKIIENRKTGSKFWLEDIKVGIKTKGGLTIIPLPMLEFEVK